MIGLDTNVLVRYLTGDDERQFRTARRFLEEVETAGDTVRVDHVVLAELSWVLQISYRFDRATLVAALERLLETVEITIEDRDVVRDALSDFASGKGGFADYLIGSRNRAAGCSMTVTFDRALRGGRSFRVL